MEGRIPAERPTRVWVGPRQGRWILHGTMHVEIRDRSIVAYELSTGERRWETELTNAVPSEIFTLDDEWIGVYAFDTVRRVHAADGLLGRVDVLQGQKGISPWIYPDGAGGYVEAYALGTPPAEELVEWRANDGEVAWASRNGRFVKAGNGTVVLAHGGGDVEIECIRRHASAWRSHVPTFSHVETLGSLLLLQDLHAWNGYDDRIEDASLRPSWVHALSVDDGTVRWRSMLPEGPLGPSLANLHVICSFAGRQRRHALSRIAFSNGGRLPRTVVRRPGFLETAPPIYFAAPLAIDDRFLVYKLGGETYCVPIAVPEESVWCMTPSRGPVDLALDHVWAVTSDHHVVVFGE